jgi:hypothetical protein
MNCCWQVVVVLFGIFILASLKNDLFFFASPKMVCSFLLLQKRTKKGAPKTMTPGFREGAMIKQLYYCKLKFSSLIVVRLNVIYFDKVPSGWCILLYPLLVLFITSPKRSPENPA